MNYNLIVCQLWQSLTLELNRQQSRVQSLSADKIEIRLEIEKRERDWKDAFAERQQLIGCVQSLYYLWYFGGNISDA